MNAPRSKLPVPRDDGGRRPSPEDYLKLQASAREASRLLKALSNENRLLIMCQLVGGERSVGELVRLIGLSQSALSQHLAKLRHESLVRTRRDAQTIYYSLASPEAEAVIATLYDLYCTIPDHEPA
ncbi:MAG TPA: ArsR family transcriptional regulator [Rhodospirillales bacterium]|nr:ArsR family transcriptional regulator [Rhodospirillales bacterium]